MSLFSRAMDHFARKRPNGLVSRFRRALGWTDEERESAHNEMLDLVQRAIDEYDTTRERRKGPPK